MLDFKKLSGVSIVERQMLERIVGNVSCRSTLLRAFDETSLSGELRLAFLAVGDSGGFASTNSVREWTNLSIERTEDLLGQLVELGLLRRAASDDTNYWIAWGLFEESDQARVQSGHRQWMPSSETRRRILERDEYACTYCGAKENLTLDHVIPRSKGGGHDDFNLVTCCRSCNTSKGTKSVTEFIEWRRQKGLLAT